MLDNPKGQSGQDTLGFIEEGFVTLSAIQMKQVLLVAEYDHQRPVDQSHVAVLADQMTRGNWQPKDKIDFAKLGDRLILINGYHRGYAQVRTGRAIEWTIVIHRCVSDEDLRTLYSRFDRNVRVRTDAQILRAADFAERNNLSAEMGTSLFRAVPFLASKFSLSKADQDLLVVRVIDRRLALCAEYVPAAQAYGVLLDGIPSSVKQRFRPAGISAVAFATLRYQRETAMRFWGGVVQHDGLSRGDPRLTLFHDLLTRKKNSGGVANGIGPAIIAWNSFFNEGELKQIKVIESFKPVIDGTPFDGRRG